MMKYFFFSAAFFAVFSLGAQQPKGVISVTPQTPASSKTWAVVVGISDYQNRDITDLQYAHRDADAFAQYLQSPAGGGLDNSHITLLLNEKATAGQFASALDWLLEKAKEGDQTIIYFSGHGDVERKTITQPGFLLCWDAPSRVYMGGGAFGLLYLQEVISTLSLQTKAKVLVITDACRAGKLAGSAIGGAQATAANLAKQYANEVKIMSCQPDELSLEGTSWGGGRGVFSYFFLSGIEGLADRNGDGMVSLLEIERYLADQVPAATDPHPQIPMTVGSKSTVIAKVDPATLAALQKKEDPNARYAGLLAGNDKGILKNTQDSTQEQYQRFKKALEEGRLLYPESESAWVLFERLKDNPEMAPYQGQMRRNLAAALQDEAQQAVNDYLKADPVELRKRWSYDKRYERFPEYLGKAADLLGQNHFLYKSLKAREHYFTGLNQRLRGEREKDGALYQLAIAEQNKSLQLDSNAAYACNELGLLARRLGQYPASIQHFKQAIVRSPGWVLPWANLCGSYVDTDAYADAEMAGKQAIMADSTFVLAHYNLGATYTYKTPPDLAAAKLHYKKVILYDSTYSRAYFKLGYVYFKENSFAEAEQSWLGYNRLVPNDPDVLVNLGIVSDLLHKKEQVVPYFQQALKVNPEYDLAYSSMGDFYLNQGQYAEAEEAFLRYVALQPKDPAGYYSLACIKALQNQEGPALEMLEKALANGYQDIKTLREDQKLAGLRQKPAYTELLARFFPGKQ